MTRATSATTIVAARGGVVWLVVVVVVEGVFSLTHDDEGETGAAAVVVVVVVGVVGVVAVSAGLGPGLGLSLGRHFSFSSFAFRRRATIVSQKDPPSPLTKEPPNHTPDHRHYDSGNDRENGRVPMRARCRFSHPLPIE